MAIRAIVDGFPFCVPLPGECGGCSALRTIGTKGAGEQKDHATAGAAIRTPRICLGIAPCRRPAIMQRITVLLAWIVANPDDDVDGHVER